MISILLLLMELLTKFKHFAEEEKLLIGRNANRPLKTLRKKSLPLRREIWTILKTEGVDWVGFWEGRSSARGINTVVSSEALIRLYENCRRDEQVGSSKWQMLTVAQATVYRLASSKENAYYLTMAMKLYESLLNINMKADSEIRTQALEGINKTLIRRLIVFLNAEYIEKSLSAWRDVTNKVNRHLSEDERIDLSKALRVCLFHNTHYLRENREYLKYSGEWDERNGQLTALIEAICLSQWKYAPRIEVCIAYELMRGNHASILEKILVD